MNSFLKRVREWLNGRGRPGARGAQAQNVQASIENVDANATEAAAAEQTAADAAARRQRSPADQGGEG